MIIDRTYKDLLHKNKQEQDLLELKLKNLKNSEEVVKNKLNDLEKLKNKLNDLEKLKNKLYEFIDNVELTPSMVNSLIERIELDFTKIIDGKKTKNINIVYKFIDMSINLE